MWNMPRDVSANLKPQKGLCSESFHCLCTVISRNGVLGRAEPAVELIWLLHGYSRTTGSCIPLEEGLAVHKAGKLNAWLEIWSWCCEKLLKGLRVFAKSFPALHTSYCILLKCSISFFHAPEAKNVFLHRASIAVGFVPCRVFWLCYIVSTCAQKVWWSREWLSLDCWWWAPKWCFKCKRMWVLCMSSKSHIQDSPPFRQLCVSRRIMATW